MTVATVLVAGVPVNLGRDEARLRARRELADPVYDAEPSLLERVVEWVLARINDLVTAAASVSPGSWVGLGILVALLGLAWAVVRRRMGPLARRGRGGDAVFEGPPRGSDDHRADADAAARAGDWSRAVIERYRAVVRSLEERALLDPRPGRTADEAASEASVLLPGCAPALAEGARTFDGVRYGGLPATGDDDTRLRQLDRAVSQSRPEPLPGRTVTGSAVPG